MAIQHFQDGNPSARDKLNQLVDAVNVLSNIRGDERHISVTKTQAGVVVSLSIEAVRQAVGASSGYGGYGQLHWLKVYKPAASAGDAPTYTVLGAPEGWTVPAKLCGNRKGENEGVDVTAVLTETSPNGGCRWPNVRVGAVIGCMMDTDGAYIVVTDYLDDAIHVQKVYNGLVANIPKGWALCDGSTYVVDGENITVADLRARFIVGLDPTTGAGAAIKDANYAVSGNTGGFRRHGFDAAAGLDENNHADHEVNTHVAGNLAGDIMVPPDSTVYRMHTMTDNRPPYYVEAWIERVD